MTSCGLDTDQFGLLVDMMPGLSQKLSAENFSTQGIGGGSFGAVAVAHPFVLHQNTVRRASGRNERLDLRRHERQLNACIRVREIDIGMGQSACDTVTDSPMAGPVDYPARGVRC